MCDNSMIAGVECGVLKYKVWSIWTAEFSSSPLVMRNLRKSPPHNTLYSVLDTLYFLCESLSALTSVKISRQILRKYRILEKSR